MKFASTSLLVILTLFVAKAPASVVITGTASASNATAAYGELNGVDWTAITFDSSPFIGINHTMGNRWDAGLPLAENSLFVTADNVNAGDFQLFRFAEAVENLMFYVENFDTGSVANIHSDAEISVLVAGDGMSYASTAANSGTLSTSNTTSNGVGDVILQLSGPTTYISFDYTAGGEANGIFYGFAQTVAPTAATAVPEPSSFLFLLITGSGLAYLHRRRKNASLAQTA